jgi:hypothetical protein
VLSKQTNLFTLGVEPMKSFRQIWPALFTSALLGMTLLTGCNSNSGDDAPANEQF